MPANCYLDLVQEGMPRQRFAIPLGGYLVISRRNTGLDTTMELAAGGDRLLGSAAIEIAERFIESRDGRSGPKHRLGLRTRVTDVELDDTGVSRTHAMVFNDQQGLSIVDLMSTNGTYINGTAVNDLDLEAGDIIRIGASELRVVID